MNCINSNATSNDNLHHILNILIEKHEKNDYVYSRLCNYIEKLLPIALENSVIISKQRETRKKQLTYDHDEFTNRFIQKNNYFYSSQSEYFLHYDGLHFNLFNEDDIHHQVLSTITNEQNLMDWKYKTNNNILKRIKEKTPLSAIPESATIQFVINSLCPLYFSTRNQAKYFLTIIGDCLTAKFNTSINNNLIYIISPLFKELLKEISNQSCTFFGVSTILNNIKFKFYDHNYVDCRLVQFNNKVKPASISVDLLKHMIDLLCVASHYSQRYGTADNFLHKCADVKLVEHALYLNKNTTDTIVDKFLERTITVLPSSKVNGKNMIFLWKNYLGEQNIPNILFYANLKNILKEKYKYEEETDCYLDITSSNLPLVSRFIKFWDSTIIEDNSNDSELEIDELLFLFKHLTTTSANIVKNINETLMVDLIHHFYPDISIVDNKFIQHIKSNIWDKRNDVINSLELFKLKCGEQEEEFAKSLNDAYEYYTSSKNLINVSKHYFEIVAIELINNHIDEDGLIKTTWWKM
jgi:hypothetical protein